LQWFPPQEVLIDILDKVFDVQWSPEQLSKSAQINIQVEGQYLFFLLLKHLLPVDWLELPCLRLLCMFSLHCKLLSRFLWLTPRVVKIKEADDGVLLGFEIILLLIFECSLLGLGVNHSDLLLGHHWIRVSVLFVSSKLDLLHIVAADITHLRHCYLVAQRVAISYLWEYSLVDVSSLTMLSLNILLVNLLKHPSFRLGQDPAVL
jgi:hypothetical protein